MKIRLNLFLFTILSLPVASYASSNFYEDAYSTSWINESEITSAKTVATLRQLDLWIGGEVGLYDHGHVSEKTFGEGRPNSSSPLSIDDHYEIGSVSKSFTGILLALAIEETPGLSLDNPLVNFIPEIKNPYAATLTLRQLATHTSGLPDDPPNLSSLPGYDPANPYENFSESQLVDFLNSVQPNPKLLDPKYPGHYLRSYSNCGFATLGVVLTRIYNTSFDSLIQAKLAGPLRMRRTFVNRKDSVLPADFLTAFGIGKNPVPHMAMDAYAPAGAIVSTLPDMMKYLRANLRAANHPHEKLERAMQLSQQQGLGWDSYPGDKIIEKNGQTMGFSAFISFDPAHSRGTIEMSNMYSVLSDWVAALPIQQAAPTSDQIYTYSKTNLEKDTVPLPAATQAKLVGSYTGTTGQEVDSATLSVQQNSLLFSVQGQPTGLFLAVPNKNLFWIYNGITALGTIALNQDSTGNIIGFTFNGTDSQGNATTEVFTRH